MTSILLMEPENVSDTNVHNCIACITGHPRLPGRLQIQLVDLSMAGNALCLEPVLELH